MNYLSSMIYKTLGQRHYQRYKDNQDQFLPTSLQALSDTRQHTNE